MDEDFLKLQLNHNGAASASSAATPSVELPSLRDFLY